MEAWIGLVALGLGMLVAVFAAEAVRKARSRRRARDERTRQLVATPDELAKELRAAVGQLWSPPPPWAADLMHRSRGWSIVDLHALASMIEAAFAREQRQRGAVDWFDSGAGDLVPVIRERGARAGRA